VVGVCLEVVAGDVAMVSGEEKSEKTMTVAGGYGIAAAAIRLVRGSQMRILEEVS
jgi:hypothetical protein